jgi:hypothetical protein
LDYFIFSRITNELAKVAQLVKITQYGHPDLHTDSIRQARNTGGKGRISTTYLLFKVGCFARK